MKSELHLLDRLLATTLIFEMRIKIEINQKTEHL